MKTPLWFIKLTRYEYWPISVFYAPFLFYWVYLSLKAKDFGFLFRLNPGMKFGGAIGADKMTSLKPLAAKYLPITLLVFDDMSFDDLVAQIQLSGLDFPVIAKPNNGERGKGVEKIMSSDELKTYWLSHKGELLIQEFVDSRNELGVLYYKDPKTGMGMISSVVRKGFLQVTGDGKATLRHLINTNTRARFRQKYLYQKFIRILDDVLPQGQTLFLEPVGNHCRGTEFISGQSLINNDLIKVFDQICESIPELDYGRFDIKIESVERMYKGDGIKIMEINGVNAEPAHIYDKEMSLFGAYKEVKKHFDIIFEISRHRRDPEKEDNATVSDFLVGLRDHTKPSA